MPPQFAAISRSSLRTMTPNTLETANRSVSLRETS
jgi:hypothetical protein